LSAAKMPLGVVTLTWPRLPVVQVPWLVDTLKSDTSTVERSGGAQGLSEVLVSLGDLRVRAVRNNNNTACRSRIRFGGSGNHPCLRSYTLPTYPPAERPNSCVGHWSCQVLTDLIAQHPFD
jgi:hypothetical protein